MAEQDPWGVKSVAPYTPPAVDPWGVAKVEPISTNIAGSGQSGVPALPVHPSVNMSEQQGFLGSAADSSGISMLNNALKHPIKTAHNLAGAVIMPVGGNTPHGGIVDAIDNEASRVGSQLKEAWNTPNSQPLKAFDRTLYAVPFVGGSLKKADEQAASGNYAGAAGTAAGLGAGMLAPEVLKTGVPMVGRAAGGAAESLGRGMQDSGSGIINTTIGALKNDFKRGANPGRAYFDAGLGPSSSIKSIAEKAANAKTATGIKLGGLYDTATDAGMKIPVADVAQRLRGPINKAVALETGPGGMGNVAPLESYASGFRPTFDSATQAGGFTPRGLFDMKRDIAQNTNWSDPTQFNLKSVRQQQAGALSGVLADALPDTAPLNSLYGGLNKLAARTASRMDTGSSPLTTLAGKTALSGIGTGVGAMAGHSPLTALGGGLLGLAADSVPVKTSLASGLFYGGKGIAAAGGKIKSLFPPTSSLPGEEVATQSLGKDQNNNYSNNPQIMPPRRASLYLPEPDYSEGGFPARDSIVTPAPPARLQLPAQSSGGATQPMIGVKAPIYPPLAEGFARDRIRPNEFAPVQSLPTRNFTAGPQGLYGDVPMLPAPAPNGLTGAELPNARVQQLVNAMRNMGKKKQ